MPPLSSPVIAPLFLGSAAVEADALRDPDLGGIEVGRVVEHRLGRPAEGLGQLGLPELHGVASAAEQSHRA